ncbi:hypothetical protein ATE84_0838 [Aquimarina sp. MAR_2010_214]|nr:hypothetical protein ATE84_0838 [Aquimarina sp. MAR_2010_214]
MKSTQNCLDLGNILSRYYIYIQLYHFFRIETTDLDNSVVVF